MKWFVVAFIVYAETSQIDMKVNTALLFNNLERCAVYVEKYGPILKQGLRRSFPEMKELALRCVNEYDAAKLREKMLKRGLTK